MHGKNQVSRVNEVLALQLLYGFLGVMLLLAVLLVLRLSLKGSSKVNRWQQLAAEHGWTLTHQPTQTRQWQLSSAAWRVLREEPLREDLPVRGVFESHLDGDCQLLVVGSGLWKRWQVFLQGPATLQKLRLREQGVEGLPEFLATSQQVVQQDASWVVFSPQPGQITGVLPEVVRTLGELPLTDRDQRVHLWVAGGNLTLQVTEMDWEEVEVLSLIQSGETLTMKCNQG